MAQQVVPSDALEDGSLAAFLQSTHNYEDIDNAAHSVLSPDTSGLSKNQAKKADKAHNDQVRAAVGPVVDSLFASGSIGAGGVRETYQSSHDQGADFGGERGISGVWGDKYVLHGHFNADGSTKPGSVGLKDGSDPTGMRLAHGVSDGLGGDAASLLSHWTT